jgi:imidazolonepropionase
MRLLIRNIKQLSGIRDASVRMVKGADMKQLPSLENAWLLVENGIIKDFGIDAFTENTDDEIDAKSKTVLPCWCDSHTHIVYAGSRENEFVDKIVHGLSYEEIAQRGGGILNSAKKLNDTSEPELLDNAQQRLEEIKSFGTGAVEIKSGYGLSYDGELKMLRVIKKLKETSSLIIKATFLGAHAIPSDYKNNRDGYIQLLTERLLPEIAAEGLADFVDVFCDKGFFTVDETDTILEAAAKYNLRPKIHANELDYSGGIQVGVKHKALSVDHLECCGEAEITALKNSGTMPTLLPSTAFFLNIPFAPARNMIDAGLPVSLASDYNPGSSPSGNMNFVLALACIKMKMTPEEAINAATLNSAYAMGVEDVLGSITKGKKANLIITKPISSLAYIPYSFGSNLVERTLINGK